MSSNAWAAPPRPNIIFILADDYGIPGVGSYGGAYKTPNLDDLAAKGMKFENAFAAPLCAPSRAMAMFGRYPFRTGVTNNENGDAVTPRKETSIGKVLKRAGYVTGLAGKWHQLPLFDTPDEARAWGFDEFLVWSRAGGRYWHPMYNKNGKVVTVTDNSYGPDMLHEWSVDFITRHRDETFFLYYPMVSIHQRIARTPDSVHGSDWLSDNIAYMDKLVGKLLESLDRLKLREKTLVVFAGDNGLEQIGTIGGRKINGSKGNLLEGGSRVPLIADWNGTTPRGKVSTDLVDFSDFYATFAELAGARLPEGVTLDSRSFAPQLRGNKGTPREWVYVQKGKSYYVRDARWKLTGDGALFDMTNAPFGETPASDESAQKRLQAVLDRLDPKGNSVAAIKRPR